MSLIGLVINGICFLIIILCTVAGIIEENIVDSMGFILVLLLIIIITTLLTANCDNWIYGGLTKAETQRNKERHEAAVRDVQNEDRRIAQRRRRK